MVKCKIIRYNKSENGTEARCNESSYPGQFYATATFSTAEEADRAVGMYNGSDLGGTRVVVRLDSEWDPSTDQSNEETSRRCIEERCNWRQISSTRHRSNPGVDIVA